ncbi:MerR family transcriptional regulator [Desulforhopalus sp. IMCC35007]|uniref:MerR family transcriptional regulator n=1 Tax=Desulforhopalus sp. IMCC35007 TaxID=2569543 RepID=UPI0010AE64BD|nr:MerR family transcriptional regulator [Desulforhopalus sp. IMCC35007]TKB09585.1 MerR family transcriptional regulator [Desulforhopalus sp. IMCC35007]
MNKKDQYFIGDMSRLCNISKKALRYYDEINLISSQRDDCNNYRFYTDESLLAVPVIKYYKQMGFTLEQMKEFIEGHNSNVFKSIQRCFKEKLRELEQEQISLQRKQISVKDWYELIKEAETVIENDIHEVSIKFVEPSRILFQDQLFENNNKSSIINLKFTKHVEELENAITGPVIINYSSYKDRIDGEDQNIKLLQKTIMSCRDENLYQFGGHLMVSCYHIGAHENIRESYLRIEEWACENGYVLDGESFERYVTDYWTTNNKSKFVTEILIKASRKGAGK